MTHHHFDEVRRVLVARFRKTWERGNRPAIDHYIEPFKGPQKDLILAELVPLDIEYRKQIGEHPSSMDYNKLGIGAVEVAARVLGETLSSQSAIDVDSETRIDASNSGGSSGSLKASQQIGPYRLIYQIGAGGMGVVWKAEQLEPVRRYVALKVIRGDIDSKLAISRFDVERKACAVMDHQNIATVLDAGTTESGSPYFAMELVNGPSLDEYCDQHQLGVRERLEMMLPVCKAIQHAHQKGILHRDLKHNNVLVGTYDGIAVPKVIDFGLAKVFEGQGLLNDRSFQTEHGKVVGTLQYMSPEQAFGDAKLVDTRSDVYSLGAMMYKLLTGDTPLGRKTVRSKSLITVLDMIRHVEPKRPSERIAECSEKEKNLITKRLGEKTDKVVPMLKQDLDWIVLKAIEKDPEMRYETANALQLDLQRYLNNEEVRASPPSRWNRIRKFRQRNRLLVRAVTAVFIVLLTGVIGTTYGLVWALLERNRANQNAIAAKLETENARTSAIMARQAREVAESRLHATRVKSAWSDWRLGNVEFAWKTLQELNQGSDGWENRFLHAQFTSSDNVLYGHVLGVHAVDATKDGKLIASASADNSVRIWDSATASVVNEIIVPETPNDLAFSEDGSRLVVVCRDNCISSYTVADAKLESKHGPFDSDLIAVALIKDGRQALVGSSHEDKINYNRLEKTIGETSAKLRLIDLESGKVLDEIEGSEGSFKTVSAAGKVAVSGGSNPSLQVFEFNDAKLTKVSDIETKFSKVTEFKLNHDGSSLVVCGDSQSFYVHRVSDGKLLHAFSGHDATVTDVDYSLDGKRIVSCGIDLTARLWTVEGEQKLEFRGHYDSMSAVRFLGDSDHFVTAADDATMRTWNAKSNRSLVESHPHTDVIWQAVFSPDESIVFSASEDKSIQVTNADTGERIKTIEFESEVLAIDHSPVENLVAAGLAGPEVIVIDTNRMVISRRITIGENDDLYIWDLKFSRDGNQLATTSSDGTISIWNREDWSLAHSFQAHESELSSVVYSTDGSKLITSADDRVANVWDAKNFEQLLTLKGHEHPIWRAVISPDGKHIATSSYDGELIFWDGKTGEILHQIRAHQSQVAGLTFSPDSRRVISASDDGSIKVWDVSTGIELLVLYDKGNSAVVHVSLSPSGSKLLTGNQEGWLTLRATELSTAEEELPPLPHDVIEMETRGLMVVINPDASKADIKLELSNAEWNLQFFPSYVSYTIAGIARYRCGNFQDAIRHLESADRFEPLEYGERDLAPVIEGFLAAAYLDVRREEDAKRLYEEYERKMANWSDEDDVQILNVYLGKKLAILAALTDE